MAGSTTRFIRLALVGLGSAFVLLLVLLAALRMLAYSREVQPRATAAPASGRFLAVRDTDVFVQEAGPSDGPVVVLIHGLGAWSETWRPTIQALTDRGFRVIALDVPPFGFSRPPADGDYSTDASARRIIDVLDALRVRTAVLVGHSFGGRATVEAAMRATGRVDALVLVTVALGLDGAGEQPAPGWLRALLGRRTPREALVAATATNPWATRFFIEQFTARHTALTDTRIEVYRAPLVAFGATPAIGNWAEQFVLRPGLPASSDTSNYGALSMPTLVLWGELDRVTPLPQGKRLAGLIPNARLEVLDGIGHIPQLEDALRFNDRLLAFLHERRKTMKRNE